MATQPNVFGNTPGAMTAEEYQAYLAQQSANPPVQAPPAVPTSAPASGQTQFQAPGAASWAQGVQQAGQQTSTLGGDISGITPPKNEWVNVNMNQGAQGNRKFGVAGYTKTVGGAGPADVLAATQVDVNNMQQAMAEQANREQAGLGALTQATQAGAQGLQNQAFQTQQTGAANQQLALGVLPEVQEGAEAAKALGPAATVRGAQATAETGVRREEALAAGEQAKAEALGVFGATAKSVIANEADNLMSRSREAERSLVDQLSAQGASPQEIQSQVTKLRMGTMRDVGRIAADVQIKYADATAKLTLAYDESLSQTRNIADQLAMQTTLESNKFVGLSEAQGVERLQAANQLSLAARQLAAEESRIAQQQADQLTLASYQLELSGAGQVADYLRQMQSNVLCIAPIVASIAQMTADMSSANSASLAAVNSSLGVQGPGAAALSPVSSWAAGAAQPAAQGKTTQPAAAQKQTMFTDPDTGAKYPITYNAGGAGYVTDPNTGRQIRVA